MLRHFTRTDFSQKAVPLCTALFLCGSISHAGSGSSTIHFSRDIRPILSNNCYLCHGPDHSTRAAKLRLDTPEGLIADLGGGRQPVKPGDPEHSELYKRVAASMASERMPPASTHKQLTQDEVKLLHDWIAQGAKWEKHWSFNKISRPDVPQVAAVDRVTNPIDSFILHQLKQHGLTLSEEADKRTLIRRVSFDLRGLPPSQNEINAFVNDDSPDAYETMIDSFMSSKLYGEHRARYWLDAARYSDTNGFHLDNYRSIWPYRDWVVDAYNRNMPFDEFTIEQLAGDLLPNASASQKVATGFNRCNPTTSEGGAIDDEYLAIYAKDRVVATSTVWLGLTLGCASCHDHKFDPLSQRDFYRMTAFFRNTTQAAMDGNAYDTPPVVRLYPAQEKTRVEQIKPQLERLKKALSGLKQPSTNSVNVASNGAHWVAAEVQESLDEHSCADFDKDSPFSMSFWVFVPTNSLTKKVPLFSKGDSGTNTPGWAVNLAKNKRIEFLLQDDSESPDKLNLSLNVDMKTNAWNHVAMTYSGLRQFGVIPNLEAAFSVYLNGRKAKTKGVKRNTRLRGNFRNEEPFKLQLPTRSDDGVQLADLRIYNQVLTEPEKVLLASTRLSEAVSLTNKTEAVAKIIPQQDELESLLKQFRTLRHEQAVIRANSPVSLVMEERKNTAPFAHVLNRGQYDQPGEKVSPGIPSIFPPLPQGASTNRLTLARWLVAPDNPLTARVTVNRFWQELFGTGIVKTSEDFGSQGELPSHFELLDWLAAEFIESGWDVKYIYKLMLMSSTYRQRSEIRPELLKADPDNRLLSRGPRYRFDAEVIRDEALSISKLLVSTQGGPPVKPYQPAGIWQAVAYTRSNTAVFEADHDSNLYRRSLYTFWKRTAPAPTMVLFDAPSRESCSVRRERTNTPLQALALMNDPQFVEAARNLAQHVLASSADDKFSSMLSLALGHEPSEDMTHALRSTYEQVLPLYQNDIASAEKLIRIGESHVDDSLDPSELAAWTIVANQVMNMDAFITKN